MLTRLTVTLLVLLVPSLVQAAESETIAAPNAVSEAGRTADPNTDRGFLMPTALTQPAGTLTLSNYELLVFGATYGVTDRLQVSGTVLLAVPFTDSRLYAATLKWQALRTGPWRLALMGGAAFVEGTSHGGGRVEHRFVDVFPLVAAALSYCLTDDCASTLSATSYVWANANDNRLEGVLFSSASVTARAGRHIKLLAEVLVVGSLDRGQVDIGNGGVFSAGIRLHNAHVAGDLGVMTFLDTGGDAVPAPFFNLTVRF